MLTSACSHFLDLPDRRVAASAFGASIFPSPYACTNAISNCRIVVPSTIVRARARRQMSDGISRNRYVVVSAALFLNGRKYNSDSADYLSY